MMLLLAGGGSTLYGQWIYSLGVDEVSLGPQLQRIHLKTQQVVKVVDLSQPLGDIAFHPDGTLYGVYIDRFYEVDTLTGAVTLLPGLPAITFMTGLTIDHKGVFYISAGAVEGNLYRYDPVIGTPVLMGAVYNHMDAAFYNGELYVAGILPSSFGDRSHITRVDTSDFSKSEIVVQYEKWPGLALASYSNPCGSQYLVSPTIGYLNYFVPPFDSIRQIAMPAPLNFQSAGAASRQGYLGSIPPLLIDHLDVIQDPCDVTGEATIQVVPAPGREDIEFSINGTDYQSSYVFDNVPPGTYQVSIRDDLGCSDTSDYITIEPFEPIVVEVETTTAHCAADNGEVLVLPSGNSDSWMYALDGAPFTSDSLFSGLSEGIHSVVVMDHNGCTAENAFEITAVPPPAMTFSTEPEICNMANAAITLTASAGEPPFTYTLSTVGSQSDGTFTGLKAGTYTGYVEDALGCIVESDIVVEAVGGPQVTGIAVENAHCGMPDGSFELTTSGTGQLSFSMNGGPFVNTSSFTGISPGDYTVVVRDGNDCEISVNVTVPEESGPVITALHSLDATCDIANGSISAEAAAGVQYSIDGAGFQTDNTFTNLDEGVYTIWIRDTYGCRDSAMISVQQTGSPEITGVFVTGTFCGQDNGEIVVMAEGGQGDLFFILDNGDADRSPLIADLYAGTYTVTVRDESYCTATVEAVVPDQEGIGIDAIDVVPADCGQENGIVTFAASDAPARIMLDGSLVSGHVFENVAPGEHQLIIEDAQGCTAERTFVVAQDECGIYIPNAFSSNGDGINDVFTIVYDPGAYDLTSMRIVDRWGATIFDCSGACKWDGTADSTSDKVAAGVYLYRIVLTDTYGEEHAFLGDITVMN